MKIHARQASCTRAGREVPGEKKKSSMFHLHSMFHVPCSMICLFRPLMETLSSGMSWCCHVPRPISSSSSSSSEASVVSTHLPSSSVSVLSCIHSVFSSRSQRGSLTFWPRCDQLIPGVNKRGHDVTARQYRVPLRVEITREITLTTNMVRKLVDMYIKKQRITTNIKKTDRYRCGRRMSLV